MARILSNPHPLHKVTGIPRLEVHRYFDIEDQANSVAGHTQIYSQLSAGRFDGALQSCIVSDRTAFFIESTNRSIRKQFHVLPGHLRIGFLLDETARFKCIGNGAQLPASDVSINLSMTPIDLHFTDEYLGCWITLDEREVTRMIPERSQIRGFGRFQVMGWAAQLFRKTITAACEELFKPQGPPPSAGAVLAFERTLFSMAAWMLTTTLDPGLERAPNHRARLLRRACEEIDAKLCEGLTMSQLCVIVGTSRRSLENIFMEAFGVSPYQYVRAVRLNAIHRALRAEKNAKISIGDIAAKWGLWHLSRFAADYRRLFGNLPSQARPQSRIA